MLQPARPPKRKDAQARHSVRVPLDVVRASARARRAGRRCATRPGRRRKEFRLMGGGGSALPLAAEATRDLPASPEVLGPDAALGSARRASASRPMSSLVPAPRGGPRRTLDAVLAAAAGRRAPATSACSATSAPPSPSQHDFEVCRQGSRPSSLRADDPSDARRPAAAPSLLSTCCGSPAPPTSA